MRSINRLITPSHPITPWALCTQAAMTATEKNRWKMERKRRTSILDQPSKRNQPDQPNQPSNNRRLTHGQTREKRKGTRSKSPSTEETPTQPTDTAWEPGMHLRNNNGDPNKLTRHLQQRRRRSNLRRQTHQKKKNDRRSRRL